MNIFFSTQGVSLDLWHLVSQHLRHKVPEMRVGYFATFSQHYDLFRQTHPDFPASEEIVIKEWEVMAAAKNSGFDPEVIKMYEHRLGNPNLWGPLVGDRRIYLGKKATYRQDYRPRFTHIQMLAILQQALIQFDKVFQSLQPDVVITTYPATFGDYLAYLFGQERGCVTLDVRLSRIKNLIFAAESIFEPSEYLRQRYERFEREGCSSQLLDAARQFVTEYRSGRPIYDGMIMPGRQPAQVVKVTRRPVRPLRERITNLGAYWLHGYARDNHIPNPIEAYLYRTVINPAQQRIIARKLKHQYLTLVELPHLDYAFYPLHTEPELTLNVYARPFLNQIEVVRLLSHSLPVHWTLIVKEHPATLGRRPYGYYEKLLEIPNVRLVPPNLPASLVVQHAKLVGVITGSVALEALMSQVPVVILGSSPFDYLPRTMVRRVRDLYALPGEITDLVRSYQYDEESLLRFIAAVMDVSVPINLVTDLLSKGGRFRDSPEGEHLVLASHPHLPVLADYIWRRISESKHLADAANVAN